MIRWIRILARKAAGQSLAEQGVISWTEQKTGAQPLAKGLQQRPKSNAPLLPPERRKQTDRRRT